MKTSQSNEKAENDPVDRLGGGRNRLCSRAAFMFIRNIKKEKRQSVRLKPVIRQKCQEEEDLANEILTWNGKKVPPQHGDAGDSLHRC